MPLNPVSRRALLGGALAVGLGVATAGRATAANGAWINWQSQVSAREFLVDIGSVAMNRSVKARVLLPENYFSTSLRYPVVYMLHGSQSDHDTWCDQGGARWRTAGTQAIYVMPDGGQGGWYSDHRFSGVGRVDWEVFHTQHLVSLVDENLRTLPWAGGRGIVGFSMGGYGAAKYAGKHPDLFGAMSSYSGATDSFNSSWRSLMYSGPANDGEAYGAIYGTYPGQEDTGDLWLNNPGSYASALRGRRVRLYAGDTADFEAEIRASSTAYRDALVGAGVQDAQLIVQSGGHSWGNAGTAFSTDLPGLLGALARPA